MYIDTYIFLDEYNNNFTLHADSGILYKDDRYKTNES